MKYGLLLVIFTLSACGVKKAPMPLYSYPSKTEGDLTTPTPQPIKGHP